MEKTNFEKLTIYQLSEKLSDIIWSVIKTWNHFEKDTIGKQLARAADSVGANIAEGSGRGTLIDNRRFLRIARGSLNETRHWLRRAHTRNLIAQEQVQSLSPLIAELTPKLNAYISSIENAISK